MREQFLKDLAAAKPIETLVLNELEKRITNYTFRNVSDIPKYWYKGDIEVANKNNEKRYIDVKDDSRIAETHNVLCEFGVYDKERNRMLKGNMSADYDFIAVHSSDIKTIYLIDFSILKRIYTKGRYKVIPHPTQTTYCYLLPLSEVEAAGALVATIKY